MVNLSKDHSEVAEVFKLYVGEVYFQTIHSDRYPPNILTDFLDHFNDTKICFDVENGKYHIMYIFACF